MCLCNDMQNERISGLKPKIVSGWLCWTVKNVFPFFFSSLHIFQYNFFFAFYVLFIVPFTQSVASNANWMRTTTKGASICVKFPMCVECNVRSTVNKPEFKVYKKNIISLLLWQNGWKWNIPTGWNLFPCCIRLAPTFQWCAFIIYKFYAEIDAFFSFLFFHQSALSMGRCYIRVQTTFQAFTLIFLTCRWINYILLKV